MHALNKKEFKPEDFVRKVTKNPDILLESVNNLLVKNDTIRYNSHKVLLLISENNPELLYPQWDFFAKLLNSKNNFHKVIGIQIIANLVKIDNQNRFEKIFETYSNLLDAKSVMTAGHLAANLGKIAKVKSNLRDKITKALLSINKTHHEPSCKELIKASIIDSFSEYFNIIEDKEPIINFVNAQLKSQSPKTRKTAQTFLKKLVTY